MFEKKLSKEDLEELRKRTELINSFILVSQSLEIQKQIYIRNILPKYGLDGNKNYNINLKNGKITELKTGQIKEAKEKPQPQK